MTTVCNNIRRDHPIYIRVPGISPFFLAIVLLFFSPPVQSQSNNEQTSSRMALSAIQGDEDSITLNALMRARIEGRYVGLPNLEVIFHSLLLDSLGKEIGTVLTDENGIAQLTIPSGTLYRDTSWQYEFMAEFKGNDLYGESDDAISIISAELNLEQEEEDSVKIAGITLHSKGEPIVDEYVELFVKTHFNPYRLGEASTDDHGRASIPIPDYLKSDAEGNIHVFARLDDHNDYGTLIANATIVWGLADHHNLSTDLPASLWSQDPPLWLLFTFLAILFTIWIHYIGTIYKLYKMKIDSKKLMEEETV